MSKKELQELMENQNLFSTKRGRYNMIAFLKRSNLIKGLKECYDFANSLSREYTFEEIWNKFDNDSKYRVRYNQIDKTATI